MPPTVSRLRTCAGRGCGRTSASGVRLRVCARCKTSHYCSTDCQAKDWSDHKLICNTNSSVDQVFRLLSGPTPGGLSETARLSSDLRRWEALHTSTFITSCIHSMNLCDDPQNLFKHALLVKLVPRESSGHRTKFSVAFAELKPFDDVSLFLRVSGYAGIMDRHKHENQITRASGGLGHALVLLHCEVPSLPRLLQIKPVLITHEAIDAQRRSPVPFRLNETWSDVLQRAINEDWAKLFHVTPNCRTGRDTTRLNAPKRARA
ncbi:hypothetical protein BDV93DRAFT_526713 [Ceratobasidium sp. AG-I]|nr:hypothetical protein BDV93DRAFT_526713 [Ceratobasidium sp. AG-I]